jgi:hypothetical protein
VYLQAVFAIVVSAVVTLAWFQVTAARILIDARHLAGRYATTALERAQDDLMESIAVQVAAGNLSGPFVAPTSGPPLPACTGATPCAFTVTTSVALAGATQASGAGNVVAANLQRNGGVAEQRVAAVVTVTVQSASGAVFANVARRIELRTFAAYPYVALSGVDEPTVERSTVADFAGTCDGSASCGGNDGRIHAWLRCADPNPANCAGAPLLPADTFASPAWQNSNAVAPAWSR